MINARMSLDRIGDGGARKLLAQRAGDARRAAKADHSSKIMEGIKNGVPCMSLKVLFKRHELTKYYKLFANAGYDTIECWKPRTDDEAEKILQIVETKNKITFPQVDRGRLWKAFRTLSFSAPKN